MNISISEYLSYHTVNKTYRIKRKNCKITSASDFAKSIAKKSINTASKATELQLNKYYNTYGCDTQKKYNKINVDIEYKTIDEFIAAIKTFLLSHHQISIDTIHISDSYLKCKSVSKSDKDKLKRFKKSETDTVYNPLQNKPNKKRKLNDSSAAKINTNNENCNPIVAIIKTVLTTVLTLLLTPIKDKICSLFNLTQNNNAMLCDIHDHISPVNMNTVGKRYRPWFGVDLLKVIDHFYAMIAEKDAIICKLRCALNKMRKLKNCWKSKCNRRTKALNKMRKRIGQSKIVELKVNTAVKHPRFRDKAIKKLILSLSNNEIESEEDFTKFIERQFNILYRKDAKFKKMVVDKAFRDVIDIVNKNGRARELSIPEAARWIVLKICAHLSYRKYEILHGQSIWHQYTDDDGCIRKKRKENDDGTIETFMCSRYMMNKGLGAILEEYPEFKYNNIFKDCIYHSSLIRLILIYLTIFAVAGDMQAPFLLSEKNVKKRFASRIADLDGDQRLFLDFGTFRSVDCIDTTPLKNVSFGGGTNWALIIEGLFESGWNGASLRCIHHAFSTKKDTSNYTMDFNDTVLEAELIILQRDGIILSYPNLPIDAAIKFDTMFNGDLPLTAALKFAIQHNGDYGMVCDTVILTKDSDSLKTDYWKHNLTPTWMYKEDYIEMAEFPRIDSWREYTYDALPDQFTVHLTYDIHFYINDKIDDYIKNNPIYEVNSSRTITLDASNMDHRKIVAKILKSAIYNRCNKRALWYNFEFLHAGTCLTGYASDMIVDECRNTLNLKNESIIAGAGLVGHSNFQKQVRKGLNDTSKDKKIGSHFNGNISKRVINTMCAFIIYLMPFCDTVRELLMLMSYIFIVINFSYIFWGAMWALSHSETSSDIILDQMQDKVDQIWNGLNIYSRIQSKIPYIVRLKVEGIHQLRLYLNDDLNIHKRGAESNCTQTSERENCDIKKLFANHMNKSDEKQGIITIFIYHHIRCALGIKYGVWKILPKLDSFHWREDDLFEDFDISSFVIGEHVELGLNETIKTLWETVKDSLTSGVPPSCYTSKSTVIVNDVENDKEVEDKEHDGLEIRNVEEMQEHLANESDDDSDESDSEYDIDDDFS